MKVDRNYSGVQETGGFSPIPGGVYSLEVVKIEERETRNGDPMAGVRLKVINRCPYLGRFVFHNVVFHAADAPGAGFTKHWLRVMGAKFEGNVAYDTDSWDGKVIIARVDIETYEGKRKNVISDSWAKGDEGIPPLGVDETQTVKSAGNGSGKKHDEEDPGDPGPDEEDVGF